MEARRKHYDEEFKASAVAMLSRGDRSRRQVASDLGVNYWTLSDWYTRAMTRRRHGPSAAPPTSSPTEETAAQRIERLERENKALLKENEQLRMDRAILKKAAAFFAKESG
mgnify:CR=1